MMHQPVLVAVLLCSALVASVAGMHCDFTAEQLCKANGGGLLCNPCDEYASTYYVCSPQPYLHRCPPGSRWNPAGSHCQPAEHPVFPCTPGLHVVIPEPTQPISQEAAAFAAAAVAENFDDVTLPTSLGAAAARGSPFLRDFPPFDAETHAHHAHQQPSSLLQRLSSGLQGLTGHIQQVLNKAQTKVRDTLLSRPDQHLVVLDSADGRVIMELQQVHQALQQQHSVSSDFKAWSGSLRSAMLLGSGQGQTAVVLEDHEPTPLQLQADAALAADAASAAPAQGTAPKQPAAEQQVVQQVSRQAAPLRELAFALLRQARQQQSAIGNWRSAVSSASSVASLTTALQQMEQEAGGSVEAAAQLLESMSTQQLRRTLDSAFDADAATTAPAVTADAPDAASLVSDAADQLLSILSRAARSAATSALMVSSAADSARLSQFQQQLQQWQGQQERQGREQGAASHLLAVTLAEAANSGSNGAAAVTQLRDGNGIELRLHDNKPVAQLLPSVVGLLEYDVALRLQAAVSNQLSEMFFSQIMEVDVAREAELLSQDLIPSSTSSSKSPVAPTVEQMRSDPRQQSGRGRISAHMTVQ